MIHTQRISQESHCKAQFPHFSQVRGKDRRATNLAGKTGAALKSEVFESFAISQSNGTWLILGEKGKEVIKTQPYLPKNSVRKMKRTSRIYSNVPYN